LEESVTHLEAEALIILQQAPLNLECDFGKDILHYIIQATNRK
jgi:hypothetical protein